MKFNSQDKLRSRNPPSPFPTFFLSFGNLRDSHLRKDYYHESNIAIFTTERNHQSKCKKKIRSLSTTPNISKYPRFGKYFENETGRRGVLSKGEPYENLAGNRVLNLIKTGSSPLRWLIEGGGGEEEWITRARCKEGWRARARGDRLADDDDDVRRE